MISSILLPLGLALSACGACSRGLRVDTVWQPREDAVAVARIGDDLLVAEGDDLVRMAASGHAERWRAHAWGQVLPPATDAGEIYVVGGTRPRDPNLFEPQTDLIRLDAATGAVRGTTELHDVSGPWLRLGDALISADDYKGVTCVDGRTGSVRWRSPLGASNFQLHLTRDAAWIPCKPGLCAVALADGSDRGHIPAITYSAASSADGDVLIASAENGSAVVAYDARDLHEIWRASLSPDQSINKLAVSADWVAVISSQRDVPNGVHRLWTWSAADGKPSWQRTVPAGKYLGYLGLDGDLVVYYDSGDASFHAVHLPDATRARVRKFHETFVLSTDASGMAPAVPDGDPRVDDPFIFVKSWDKVTVYRARLRK